MREKATIGRELLAEHAHRLSEAAQKRQLDCVLYDALRRHDVPGLRIYFLKRLALDPILLQVTLDHYRHHREGLAHVPCLPVEGIPNCTLADTGITLADLEAVRGECPLP